MVWGRVAQLGRVQQASCSFPGSAGGQRCVGLWVDSRLHQAKPQSLRALPWSPRASRGVLPKAASQGCVLTR